MKGTIFAVHFSEVLLDLSVIFCMLRRVLSDWSVYSLLERMLDGMECALKIMLKKMKQNTDKLKYMDKIKEHISNETKT